MVEPRDYPELDPNGKFEFMATTIIDRDPTILPENNEQSDDACLTILFAEAVCSKIAVNQEGVNAAQTAMDASDELILNTVQKHQGRVIKAMGASVIAEFSNPTGNGNVSKQSDGAYMRSSFNVALKKRAHAS